MTVEPTDKLLVNRDGSSFYINAENMAELRDTDLMLVCRDGYSYKATGKEIKDSTGGNPVAPTIGDAVLTGPSSFAGGTFETTLTEYNSGNPIAQQSLKAKVVGPYAVVGETSPITDIGESVIYSDNFSGNPVLYPSNDTGPFKPDIGYIFGTSQAPSFTYSGPTISGIGKLEVAWMGANSSYGNNTITLTSGGVDYTVKHAGNSTSVPTFVEILTGNFSFNTFTINKLSQNSGGFAGFRINGERLLDIEGRLLTLTDDTNLHNGLFEVDDVVKASNQITAFSSQVSNGSPGLYSNGSSISPFTVADWDNMVATDPLYGPTNTSAGAACIRVASPQTPMNDAITITTSGEPFIVRWRNYTISYGEVTISATGATLSGSTVTTNVYVDTTIVPDNGVTEVKLSFTQGFAFGYIESTIATITAISAEGVTPPTMTVSGGRLDRR